MQKRWGYGLVFKEDDKLFREETKDFLSTSFCAYLHGISKRSLFSATAFDSSPPRN